MKKIALAMLCVGLASSSGAATWVVVGGTADHSLIAFYDLDSVQRSGNTITLWNRWVYAKPRHDGAVIHLYQIRYRCLDRTSEFLASTAYDSAGNPSRPVQQYFSPEPIVPGTFGEDMFKVYCSVDFPNNVDREKAGIEDPDRVARAVFDLQKQRADEVRKSKKK